MEWGTWVAAFCSGPDARVLGASPAWGSLLSRKPASLSPTCTCCTPSPMGLLLSLCLSFCPMRLSNKQCLPFKKYKSNVDAWGPQERQESGGLLDDFLEVFLPSLDRQRGEGGRETGRERGPNRLPAQERARCRAGSSGWCVAKCSVKPCSSSNNPKGISLQVLPAPPPPGTPGRRPRLLPDGSLAPLPQESALRGRCRRSWRLAPRLPGLSCSVRRGLRRGRRGRRGRRELLPRWLRRRRVAVAVAAEGARPWQGGQHLGHLPLAPGQWLLSPPLPLSAIVYFCEGFS